METGLKIFWGALAIFVAGAFFHLVNKLIRSSRKGDLYDLEIQEKAKRAYLDGLNDNQLTDDINKELGIPNGVDSDGKPKKG